MSLIHVAISGKRLFGPAIVLKGLAIEFSSVKKLSLTLTVSIFAIRIRLNSASNSASSSALVYQPSRETD